MFPANLHITPPALLAAAEAWQNFLSGWIAPHPHDTPEDTARRRDFALAEREFRRSFPDHDAAWPRPPGLLLVCPKCGSDDVGADASARWDPAGQEWVLSCVHDGRYCNACGADEIRPVEMTVPQPQDARP